MLVTLHAWTWLYFRHNVILVLSLFAHKSGGGGDLLHLVLHSVWNCVSHAHSSVGHGVDAQGIFVERIAGATRMFMESRNKSYFC